MERRDGEPRRRGPGGERHVLGGAEPGSVNRVRLGAEFPDTRHCHAAFRPQVHRRGVPHVFAELRRPHREHLRSASLAPYQVRVGPAQRPLVGGDRRDRRHLLRREPACAAHRRRHRRVPRHRRPQHVGRHDAHPCHHLRRHPHRHRHRHPARHRHVALRPAAGVHEADPRRHADDAHLRLPDPGGDALRPRQDSGPDRGGDLRRAAGDPAYQPRHPPSGPGGAGGGGTPSAPVPGAGSSASSCRWRSPPSWPVSTRPS